jgi:hypothetical protein
MELTGSVVLEQLRYSGIFEAVAIRRQGFPYRLSHIDFYRRYKVISPHQTWGNVKEACEGLIHLMRLNTRLVQIGVSRVMYRTEQHHYMEKQRNEAIEATVIKIQSWGRMLLAKKLRRLLQHLKPYCQSAVLLRDVQAIDQALQAMGQLPFPLHEWTELKKHRVFIVEEARLNDIMAILVMGDPELRYEEIALTVQQCNEVGLASPLAERCKLRLEEVHEKREARKLLAEGVREMDEFKIDRGLQLALKWVLEQREPALLDAAAEAKERITQEKQFMVALTQAMATGGFINDGDIVQWEDLDNYLFQATEFGLRTEEGIKIVKLASLISELRKRLALALGTKDKGLWKAVEPVLLSLVSLPGGAAHPEVIRARNECAHQAAVEDICEQIAEAVEGLNVDMIEYGVKQAEQLNVDENKYPVVPIARQYIERMKEAKQLLNQAVLSCSIPVLVEAVAYCERFGYETQEVVDARALRDKLITLDCESVYALKQLDEEHMRDCVARSELLNFSNPAIDRMRELLENTSADKLMQLQLKAALALSDPGRVVRLTIRIKDEFFKKAGNAFLIDNYPRIKKPEVWAMEKALCLDRPALAATMRKHTREPIHSSLSDLGGAGESGGKRIKFACQIFKNILGFCGDRPYRGQFILVTELLSACLQHKWLRDETYLQILKQIFQNPMRESETRAWQLLLLCMETFPPNPEFENYLENFIRTKAPVEKRELLLRTLHSTVYGGERKQPPSENEMKDIVAGKLERNAAFDQQRPYDPPPPILPRRAPVQGIAGTTPLTIVGLVANTLRNGEYERRSLEDMNREEKLRYLAEQAKRDMAAQLIAANQSKLLQKQEEEKEKEYKAMTKQQQHLLSSHDQAFAQQHYQRAAEQEAMLQQQRAHQTQMNEDMIEQHITRPLQQVQLQEEQLLYHQMSEAALWAPATHAESGQTYYYHTQTKETSWTPPPGYEQMILQQQQFAMQQAQAQQQQGGAYSNNNNNPHLYGTSYATPTGAGVGGLGNPYGNGPEGQPYPYPYQ